MKRIHFVPVVTLMLSALIFANSPSPEPDPQSRQSPTVAQRFTIERQVSTQQRINRHFHGDVVPRLKNCWGNLQGKGTITLKYTYTRAGARWIFNRAELDQSNLPSTQSAAALRCMSEAVRGTSFPADTAETESTFVLYWKWPVPFPTNATQLTTAMLAARPGQSASGDDCDGNGTPAKCYTCDLSYNCKKVCVGYKDCKLSSPGPDCTASGYCASGGPFSVTGGSRVIY